MNFWDLVHNFFDRKPEFPHLEAYLEHEQARSADPKRDVATTISFFGLFVSGFAAIGVWMQTRSYLLSSLVVLVGAALALGAYGRYLAQTSHDERELGKTKRAAREVVHELNRWKRMRRLRKKLGLAMGELLDHGARYWMQTKRTFELDIWTSFRAGGNWSELRTKAMQAMDWAMARLLLLSKETPEEDKEFLSPTFETVRQIVEGMREMAKEAARLTDKLSIEKGGSVEQSIVDIRQVLGEMHRLEDAEQELEVHNQA